MRLFILLRSLISVSNNILLSIGEEYTLKTACGTLTYANAAVNTLIIVNRCQIILNGNCALRASLFALFATDTGVFASLACICALLLVAAHNNG